jgi:hypothetical protein
MAKIWTTEADYPESRMAIYDEAKSGVERFDLQGAKFCSKHGPLYFDLPKKGLAAIGGYGVIWSDILVPLINQQVRDAIERVAEMADVQFIPVLIKCGATVLGAEYFLINPTKVVDAVDHANSEPIVVKVSGFPDAKVGFRKMVLRNDFPGNGFGRQRDSLSYIVVGDQLAAAVSSATKKGVRFISGLPPDA